MVPTRFNHGRAPRREAGRRRMPDDAAMTEPIVVENERATSLRLAAWGALGFTGLYLLHRIGQGLGPSDSSPETVTAYEVAHRGPLLASEVAVSLALLAFIAVPVGLVPVLRRAGQENIAVAVGVTSTLFIAIGFVSMGSETALANVTDDQAAVLTLNQLQGRVPVVWTFAAVAVALGWAFLRTRLVWKWLGIASIIAAVIFLLGSIFSVLGREPEGRSSNYGIGLAILWMLLVGIGLLRASRRTS